jgi:hypothetical protein
MTPSERLAELLAPIEAENLNSRLRDPFCESTVQAVDYNVLLLNHRKVLRFLKVALPCVETVRRSRALLGAHNNDCDSYSTSDDDLSEHFNPNDCDCYLSAGTKEFDALVESLMEESK